MNHAEKNWFKDFFCSFIRRPKTKTDLIELLGVLKSKQVIDTESLAMIEGVFQVSELTVAEIMIPRLQMVGVNKLESPKDFIKKIWEVGHSRFPVFDEKNEEVLGILLAKDLLKLLFNGMDFHLFDLDEYIRPVMIIPETKRLDSLLQEFRRDHQHMAIAVDEYGSVSGLVTIEDVLEQIVGSIDDEYDLDEDENYIIKQPNGSVVVKALMPLDEFNQYFSVNYFAENASTLGGYLLSRWHRMPKRNESIECGPLQFTVLHADHRRLHLISVRHRPEDLHSEI